MGRYRVLAGAYAQKEGADATPKLYHQGDVVECDTDLVARFGPSKFGRLKERRTQAALPSTAITVDPEEDDEDEDEADDAPDNAGTLKAQDTERERYQANLERMTVSQLREHAVQRKVDLKGASRKEDLVNLLLHAR